MCSALFANVHVFLWGSVYELCLNQVPHQKKDSCTLSLLSIENVGGGGGQWCEGDQGRKPRLAFLTAELSSYESRDPPGQNRSCGDSDLLSDLFK